MKIHTLILFIIIAVIVIFVGINWNQFLINTNVSVVFRNVQAPLPLIMLVLLIILSCVFFIYALYLRGSVFIKERQIRKELEDAQDLAKNAEHSRFIELRELIESESKKIIKDNSEQFKAFFTRLEKLENVLGSKVSESNKLD